MNWLKRLTGRSRPPEVPDYFFEGGNLSNEQIDRKVRSEAELHRLGIRINPHLPCISAKEEAEVPTSRDVADRILGLVIVALKGEGLEQSEVLRIIEERNARDILTDNEKRFIDDPKSSSHDQLQFVWRYEAAHVLLWALRQDGSRLERPDKICDVVELVTEVRDNHSLAERQVRATSNLLDEADLIYRYHWAVRQMGMDGLPPPEGVEPGIVMERHHALNWLIGYDRDGGWDVETTNT